MNKIEIITQIENSTHLLEEDIKQLKAVVEEIFNQIELQEQQNQKLLQHKLHQGIKQLEFLSESINLLANESENKLLQFKQVSSQVNEACQAIQRLEISQALTSTNEFTQKSMNVVQVNQAFVPSIVRHHSQFILIAKKINL